MCSADPMNGELRDRLMKAELSVSYGEVSVAMIGNEMAADRALAVFVAWLDENPPEWD
jgi:hypothetical protein